MLGQFPHYIQVVEYTLLLATTNLLGELYKGGDVGSQATLQFFLLLHFIQNKWNPPKYTFTIFHFLILYSSYKEEYLAKPSIITQYISRIILFGCGAIFNEIKKLMIKDKQGYFSYII